jgi:hypothetical protein
MRRLLIPSLTASLLLAAYASPAHAEGWREYRDCISFTFRWCKLARDGASELEETAVDAACTVMMAGCTAEAF